MEPTKLIWTPKIENFDKKKKVVQPKYVHKEAGFNINAREEINLTIKKKARAKIPNFSLTEMVLSANRLSPLTTAEGSFEELKVLSSWAVKASKITDSIERIKYLTAGFISGFLTLPLLLKGMPTIPNYPGSTLSAVGELGENYYYEHIGPGRLDARVLIIGPGDSFKLEYYNKGELAIKGMNPNCLKGSKTNPVFLEFADGVKYRFNYPNFQLDKALLVTKIVKLIGDFYVLDRTNDIIARGKVLPPPKKSLFGGFFSSSSDLAPESINQIEIKFLQKGKELFTGSGNYTSFIEIDRKVYWRFTDPVPKICYPTVKSLPSDFENYEVKELIEKKKYEDANEFLDKVEDDHLSVLKLRGN